MEPRCVWIGGAESGDGTGGKTGQRKQEGTDRWASEPGTGKESEGTWWQSRGTGRLNKNAQTAGPEQNPDKYGIFSPN